MSRPHTSFNINAHTALRCVYAVCPSIKAPASPPPTHSMNRSVASWCDRASCCCRVGKHPPPNMPTPAPTSAPADMGLLLLLLPALAARAARMWMGNIWACGRRVGRLVQSFRVRINAGFGVTSSEGDAKNQEGEGEGSMHTPDNTPRPNPLSLLRPAWLLPNSQHPHLHPASTASPGALPVPSWSAAPRPVAPAQPPAGLGR